MKRVNRTALERLAAEMAKDAPPLAAWQIARLRVYFGGIGRNVRIVSDEAQKNEAPRKANDMPVPTLKAHIDITNPKPFRRMSDEYCNHLDCASRAGYRIGALDACGRHVKWAIDYQLKEGTTWEAGLFLARYVAPS